MDRIPLAGPPCRRGLAALAAAVALSVTPVARAQTTVQGLVDTFAGSAVQSGLSVGVEVGVVIGSAAPQYFGYGVTTVGKTAPPTQTSLFYIGSLTKVFTTNLLAQSVNQGAHSLSDPLSSFSTQLGTLPTNSGNVTLGELADFTSGYPNLAPICQPGQQPNLTGCLPYTNDPAVSLYGAADFTTFFQTYMLAGPPPAGYSYSTFGVGLIGLLLSGPSNQPLANSAVGDWGVQVQKRISTPLGMGNTYLSIPSALRRTVAKGYQPATGGVASSNGIVTGAVVTNGGNGYLTPPAVTISGGNGSGATATTTLNSAGQVNGVTITNPGSNYIPDGRAIFTGGGFTSPAIGTLLISNGSVTGVALATGGSGYSSAPTITFYGGRIQGTNATGEAEIVNGSVVYVKITNPGSGYVAPLQIAFAPPPASTVAIPVWAPASALASTMQDMTSFAAAALGHTQIGTLTVPANITAAFAAAETPQACEDVNSQLTGCTTNESGLGWQIEPYAPMVISKDGAIGGYSSYLIMMPSADAAVVVLSNSFNGVSEATAIGTSVLYGMYYNGLLP